MNDIIQVENKYYISVNSTYADDRVRVLNHIDTFGIFDRWGDIKQIGEEVQGIYYNGMRFISELEFRINGERPLLLSSSIKEENEVLSVDLTNPALLNINNDVPIPKGLLYIGRSKFIRNGACYEQINIENYGHESFEFEVSLAVNADFKDIFEVRGIKREKRGEVFEIKHLPENNILIGYLGLDEVKRFSKVHFSRKPDSWERHNKALFKISLEPHKNITLEYVLSFIIGSEKQELLNYKNARSLVEKEIAQINGIVANVTTSDQQFTQWIERSQFDLLSLLATTEYGYYPYAGVPWYNTAFGRDGIITALQALWVAPEIAKGVLNFLANTQATETNAYQDAEPGKIVHEMRGGEMVEMGEVPFKRYYGSVDATPLFVMLAGAYYSRTGDIDTIKAIWPNILAAIKWVDEFADIDGDGFIDYHHKSVNGLVNQGWKDSYDSISDEEGNLAGPPIALCEVQGYVYDAKIKAAVLARELGYSEEAEQWQKAAEDLKRRFNEKYWDEDIQCYVIALESENKPCRIVSSNAGHCLYTGIADNDKAQKLSETLFAPDMFSGWGIRTLSKREKRYNPMSYHNGSIWPHDNAMIAMGFARYGLQEETLKLTNALFEASLFIELQRLPELFCGFDRRVGEGPTDYPVACSPQAWSVAAVFMLLEACLHIEIIAKEKLVYFHKPVMPESMDTIQIHNLKLGDGYADLEIYCEHKTVGVKVKRRPEGWRILIVTE
jgi:glycogen debranching enzyme